MLQIYFEEECDYFFSFLLYAQSFIIELSQ